MEISRNSFLVKQLSTLPQEIVFQIRDYDPIYRTLFSKHIIKKIQFCVFDFWNKKSSEYIQKNLNRLDILYDFEDGEIIEEENLSIIDFQKKVDNYNTIIQKIIPSFDSYSIDDESFGLLMLD